MIKVCNIFYTKCFQHAGPPQLYHTEFKEIFLREGDARQIKVEARVMQTLSLYLIQDSIFLAKKKCCWKENFSVVFIQQRKQYK